MSGQRGGGIDLQRLAWLGGADALGFICYAVALEKLQISLAYPAMTAIIMALVTVLGCVVLQEALTLPKIAGIVLITAGAFVLSR